MRLSDFAILASTLHVLCVSLVTGQEVFFGGKRFICRPSADGKDRRCCSTEFKLSSSTSQCIDLVPIPTKSEEVEELVPFPFTHPDPRFRFKPRPTSNLFNPPRPRSPLPNAKFSAFQTFGGSFGAQGGLRQNSFGSSSFNFPQGPAFSGTGFQNRFNQARRPPALPPPGTDLSSCSKCRQRSPCSSGNCPNNQPPRQIFNQQTFSRQLFPTNRRPNPRPNLNNIWPNTGLRPRPAPGLPQPRKFPNPVPKQWQANNTPPPFNLNPPGTHLLRRITPPKVPTRGGFPQVINGQIPWLNKPQNPSGPQPPRFIPNTPRPQQPRFIPNTPRPQPPRFIPNNPRPQPPFIANTPNPQFVFVTQPLPKIFPDPAPQPLLPIEPAAPFVPRPPVAPANVQLPPEYEEYEVPGDPITLAPFLSPPPPPKIEKPFIDVKAIPAPRVIPKEDTIEITAKPPKPWDLPKVIKTTTSKPTTVRTTPRPTTAPPTTAPPTTAKPTPPIPDLSNFPTPRPFVPSEPEEDEKEPEEPVDDGHDLPWPPVILPGRVPCRRPWGCRPNNVITRGPRVTEPRRTETPRPTRVFRPFRTRAPRPRPTPRKTTQSTTRRTTQRRTTPRTTRRITPRTTRRTTPRTTRRTTPRTTRRITPRTRKTTPRTTRRTTPKPPPSTQRPKPRVPAFLVFPEFPEPPKDTKCFLDLLFIIDASGSVKNTFQQELEFTAKAIDTLTLGEKGAKVALIKFAGPKKARVEFSFGEKLGKEAMKERILNVAHVSGTTETAEALNLASEEFSSERGSRLGRVKPVAILFTDGFTATDPIPAAERLRKKGVVLFALAIETPRDMNELIRITGNPSRVFTDKTFSEFQDALSDLTQDCV